MLRVTNRNLTPGSEGQPLLTGVRVNALCPQFTDTDLVSRQFTSVGDEGAKAILAETGGGLLTVEQVVDAAMELLRVRVGTPGCHSIGYVVHTGCHIS
jgi:NAD(P)-dependent dehydrogenase (short-subunit alcohol dehydrogenase family)